MQPLATASRRRYPSKEVLGAVFVAAVMLLSAGYVLIDASHSAAGSHAAPTSPAASLLAHAFATPHPAGGNGTNNTTVDQVTGTFYADNSTFAYPNLTAAPCAAANDTFNNSPYDIFIENYLDCYGGPQNPSVVNLGGGNVGVGYSDLTNVSLGPTCPGPTNNSTIGIVSQVLFQTSNDSGQNWSTPVWIGNATCAYYEAFEPSFAVANGTIYGTFVESNTTTQTTMNVTSYLGVTNVTITPQIYTNRTSAALGFTTSTTNGSSFTNATTLALAGGQNIAYPEIAAFGDSVYIVYENITNTTNLTLPGNVYGSAPVYPTSVELIYSSNGGATWTGPFSLPGLNASDDYTASSPAIAINSQGVVAVSYSTNYSCVTYYGYCYDYGGSIVVSTSTTNGSSWAGPVIVTPFAGEDDCNYEYIVPPYFGYCNPAPFEWGPRSTIGFDPNVASTLYVAWVAGYYTWNTATGNGSGEGGGGTTGSVNIGYGTALFDAVSHSTGASWRTYGVNVPESSYGYDEDHIVNPDLTVANNGDVYISYTWENETCNTICSPPFDYDTSYWVAESANGATWHSDVVATPGEDTFEVYYDWTGLSSGITVTPAGPVSVFSEGLGEIYEFGDAFNFSAPVPIYEYWDNETYPSNLIAGYPSTAPPVEVNFTEEGLPANLTWSLTLSGNTYYTNASTIQVTNVPTGATIFVSANPIYLPQGWVEEVATLSVYYEAAFYGPSTVWVNYTQYFGLALHGPGVQPGPSTTGFYDVYFDFDICVNSPAGFECYYYYYEAYTTGGLVYTDSGGDPSFPWYLPSGSTLSLSNYYCNVPISYVFGSGNGSATGPANTAVATIDGPINETFFGGVIGSYNISFTPAGLPSGTSYSFTFSGTTYTATSPASVVVPNVNTGEYTLANVYADSSNPGWVYYAPDAGSEVDVPLEVAIVLNFTTEVDTTGTPGMASFVAVGLAVGDFWQLTFNGTTYGSSSPWVNLTVLPGTYGVGAPPITASANDSVAYTPTGFGPTLAVTPGSSYSVTFALSYRVDVSSSVGGTITGSGSHWLAPGSTASYSASVAAGYTYLGWSGAGTGSYSGPSTYANITVNGPISETANFQPLPADRFPLTVTETGLPAGTWWTVDLNGTGFSTDQSTLVVSDLYSCSAGAEGQYPVSVPYVYPNGTTGVRYLGTGFPSSVCTDGSTTVSLSFHAEDLVTPMTNGHGTAQLTVDSLSLNSATWVVATSDVSIYASPDSGYAFTGWLGTGAGSYSGPLASQVITVDGPITEEATFAPLVVPPPTLYNVSFELTSSLAAGTAWSVNFNGTSYQSTSDWINLTGFAPDTYTLKVGTVYSPDRTAEYTPRTSTSPVDLTQSKVVQVGYSTSYWVTVQASAGGTTTPSGSSYVASGSTLALVATPAAGHIFVGWAGTGTGAYTGPDSSGNATVSGSLTEIATFGTPPPAQITSNGNGGSSFWSSDGGIIALAVVGLVVGLLVGYMAFRSRAPKAGAPPEWDEGGPQ